jgi:hypothetical protein
MRSAEPVFTRKELGLIQLVGGECQNKRRDSTVSVNFFDAVLPLRRAALTRKTRIAMLHRSYVWEPDKADTAEPFLKGEGGVLQGFPVRAEAIYMPGMLRG